MKRLLEYNYGLDFCAFHFPFPPSLWRDEADCTVVCSNFIYYVFIY